MSNRDYKCLLAGRLALRKEIEEPGRLPAFINANNCVQFLIRPLSDVPDRLLHVAFFTCWGSELERWAEFHDDPSADSTHRLTYLEQFLKDRILLFQPTERIDSTSNESHYCAKLKALLDAPSGINPESRLIPILNLNSMTSEEFEDAIKRRREIGPVRDFGKDMPITDPMMVVLDWYQNPLVYHGFEGMNPTRTELWRFAGEQIKKTALDPEELEGFVLPYRNIVFIEADAYFQLLLPKVERDFISLQIASRNGHASLETRVSPETPPMVIPDRLAQRGEGSLQEEEFLSYLKQRAHNQGLFYDEVDLINFHTAMKSGGLVLLSGMSGTGKSRLTSLYGDALGLSPQQHLMVSVQPTWTDDSDLLGFLDLSHNVYRPADTGVVDFLLTAERNPDQLFLLTFDEMNLARVEHYFAQFLSVLELDLDKRYLRLYSDQAQGCIYNSCQYPSRIHIGRNVLFVGTVNIDESTYRFSDKVLDRAQVIRLGTVPFHLLQMQPEVNAKLPTPPPVTFELYRNWQRGEERIQLTREELEFLHAVHEKLQGVNLQLGVGYRTLRQIDAYIQNIPCRVNGEPLLDRSQAFDRQVCQKVLTKLRGPREQLEALVGRVDREGTVVDSVLLQLMDAYAKVSDFTLSRREVAQKAKELLYYGYTA